VIDVLLLDSILVVTTDSVTVVFWLDDVVPIRGYDVLP